MSKHIIGETPVGVILFFQLDVLSHWFFDSFLGQVIQYHDFFLDKCLRECLLLSPALLKVSYDFQSWLLVAFSYFVPN